MSQHRKFMMKYQFTCISERHDGKSHFFTTVLDFYFFDTSHAFAQVPDGAVVSDQDDIARVVLVF